MVEVYGSTSRLASWRSTIVPLLPHPEASTETSKMDVEQLMTADSNALHQKRKIAAQLRCIIT
eukprot:2528425-Amphidinium_carterae.1